MFTRVNDSVQSLEPTKPGLFDSFLIFSRKNLIPREISPTLTFMNTGSDNDVPDPYATRPSLIQRLKDQHNEEAWKEFARVYSNFIYAVIRNMNISATDTEEIHQQVMVKVWAQLPKMDTEQIRRFRSYLATMTKNEVLHFIRDRKRRIAREEKAANDASLNYLNNIRLPDVEHIAASEWRIHLTNLALDNIESLFSKKAIEIFRLSINGVDPEKIAEQTGSTLSTVNTLKSRVKARFTAELNQLKTELE